MKTKLCCLGKIRIYENGKLINKYDNLFMRVGRSAFLNVLMGEPVDIGAYAFFAIGTDSKPATPLDTKLGAEWFRKPITNLEKLSDNRLLVETYLEAEEANGEWKELGLFDSSGEWTVPDSGILLNRAIVSESKNSGISRTISWTIEIL
jgi:hypothetical protein